MVATYHYCNADILQISVVTFPRVCICFAGKFDPLLDTLVITSEDQRMIEAAKKPLDGWKVVLNPFDVHQASGRY
jgi:hypothetical protein